MYTLQIYKKNEIQIYEVSFYTVFQKNYFSFFCNNFFIREPIFIIFGSNMPEEIWNRTYIVFPTSPKLCAPTLPCNTSSKSD